MRENLRRAKIRQKKYLGIDEKTFKQKYEWVEWFGWFHEWGLQSFDSAYTDSMAIIEDEKGQIHMVEPEFVTLQ